MNYIKVKDVTDFVRNGASIKQDKQCSSGIPITRIETISNSQFNWDKFGYANITNDKYQDYYLKDKDVLLSHINSAKFLGRSVLFEQKNTNPIIHGMNLLCLRFRQTEYMPSFFVWYSKSQIANNYFAENTKKAVNQASITSSAIKEMPIPDFPLEAQQKIAAELDKIQSAIDNKKQQLSLLDEAVKSEFVEMFGENPVESSKWKVEKIASVVDKNILSVKKKFQKTDTIKYVDISAIDNISNVVTGFTEYVLLEAPSRAQQVINQNDILISTVRPNLRNIAINPFNDNFMVGSSGFCVLRVNDLCNAKYLFYCVLNDDFTNAMVDLTTGAAYPAIKDSDILAYPIALPPLDLQNQFAAFVQQIDKSKFVVKQQITDLQELLDSKMQEYFS
ncbi:MAG: restriction endonuclease subunit S [Treponema succinifaciens]|uniref:restriction endonuclease subunit S n=1 Tax=Treponema succinifaciens TaxID=167 RepID=UPI0023553709|nr:restriction endonuclease subunit S [Treponema succinifaciens]MCI6913808.1 restriction endonuclease subunit S [Treponema succinifaciens]